MAGRAMDASEIAAGAIVAAVLGGRAEARDVGGEERAHDFDIVGLPDGRSVALEVTSATDPDVLSLQAAAFGKEWKAPSLASGWWVGISQDALRPPVKLRGGVMDVIVSALEVLEEHGATEVGSGLVLGVPDEQIPPAVFAARDRLLACGVVLARSNGKRFSQDGGQLLLSLHGSAGSDLDLVNELVVASVERKREKLERANTDEKHLFVWMTPSYADAELAVFQGQPPVSAPAIPPSIDVVWLATWGSAPLGGTPVERLWRVRPDRQWEVVDIRALGL